MLAFKLIVRRVVVGHLESDVKLILVSDLMRWHCLFMILCNVGLIFIIVYLVVTFVVVLAGSLLTMI